MLIQNELESLFILSRADVLWTQLNNTDLNAWRLNTQVLCWEKQTLRVIELNVRSF